MNERILKDLEMHFAKRLRLSISDIAGTCKAADIDSAETVGIVISSMLYELIRASVVMNMDEDDFVKMCEIAYRSMLPMVRREYDQ
jgi:hypothetical protein